MNLFDEAIVGLMPHVPRPIIRRFSDPYIAGETLADGIRTIRSLNSRGMLCTLDVLGENITRTDEAEATARVYHEALDAIRDNRLDSNVSLKPTALGLLLDRELCHRLIDDLCTAAAATGNFIRIDMEDSSTTTWTLDIYRRLREKHSNVGIVLQAYLRRSMADIESLLPLKPNVRVCKGIYVEPRAVAFQKPDEVRDNYNRMVERLLAGGGYVGIATHDEKLVRAGQEIVRRLDLPRTAYEFQMLLGVTEGLRKSIVDAGHRLRVYVPFGAQWYAYSTRRLKENPKVAGYVLTGFLKRLTGHG
jgi:proline dehydrogenase